MDAIWRISGWLTCALLLKLATLQSVVHCDYEYEDTSTLGHGSSFGSGAIEFYERVLLTINQRFHELDHQMNSMLIEDPVEEFLDTEDKPLLLRMEYLEENVTTAMQLNGTEAALLLFEINKEQDFILESMAANDKKHKENIDLRDERRDVINAKIDHLMSDLKDAAELQSELGIDAELDSKFTTAFKKKGINATTATEVQQYLEAFNLMEDLAENPTEFVEKKLLPSLTSAVEGDGNVIHEPFAAENDKYADLNKILVKKMVERNLDEIKPSTIIGVMLTKLAEAKETFESKLYWKYEAMAEKYVSFSKEVTVKKWTALVDKIQKLEAQVETQLKEYINLAVAEKKRRLLEEHDEL